MDGILLIDKPAGWTSFDVVAKVRGELRRKQILDLGSQKAHLSSKNSALRSKPKVGHAGTLDPFATGLLIILIGDECKKAGDYLKLDKTYQFTAKLGEVSSTGDPEGEITKYVVRSTNNALEHNSRHPELVEGSGKLLAQKEVEDVLRQFEGAIEQIPPAYSAIKINGKRAYKLAREGKAVEIPSRQITIHNLKLLEYEYPYLKCEASVSSGTYIRSLVEDIGKALNTGAYCSQLRRTKIANWSVDDADSVEQVVDILK